MNEVQKSFLAAGAVALVCSAFVLGGRVRDRIDVGTVPLAARDGVAPTWVASRENDVNVPATDFYAEMVKLLKEQYVEPVKDDQKLASGAVRGMVASLGDPRSLYMDKDEFRAFVNARRGVYEGIGADLALEMADAKGKTTPSGIQPSGETAEEVVASLPKVPRLVVTNVVPGGPAEQAGVKVGDTVAYVDDHWVVDGGEMVRFREAQRLFDRHKITYEQINKLKQDLLKKTERALLPLRARDKLIVGKTGSVKVVWNRAGATRTTVLKKAESRLPAFSVTNGVVRLAVLDSSTADQLKPVAAGRQNLTIDLRNDANGDFAAMRRVLTMLAPPGAYGTLTTQRTDRPATLAVTTKLNRPSKLTLIVDRSTRGAAEILALALSSRHVAKLTGSEMGGDHDVREIVELPDGSGYSLVTAEFKPTLGNSSVPRVSRLP